MALEQVLTEVELLCDSQTTINALVATLHSPVQTLVGVFFNIVESEKLFSKLVFSWVPRDVNVNAHQLSVWARNNMESDVLLFEEVAPLWHHCPCSPINEVFFLPKTKTKKKKKNYQRSSKIIPIKQN